MLNQRNHYLKETMVIENIINRVDDSNITVSNVVLVPKFIINILFCFMTNVL